MQKIEQGLTKKESVIFKRLNTPAKIQDFINTLPNNFEEKGETCMSPRRVLSEKKAHCIEGAMLAAAALWYHGRPPLVMHFLTSPEDEDHVVALFKESGYWGAISKSNHATMRYRDPVYKNPRELAMSYFNEYYMYEDGRKTMRGYTPPINLKKFGAGWLTAESDLWEINDALFDTRHLAIAPKKNLKKLRPVDKIEIKTARITTWEKPRGA
ncbi:MAG: hypothetical protein AAB355_00955 [Patescibacteria group bacterium]